MEGTKETRVSRIVNKSKFLKGKSKRFTAGVAGVLTLSLVAAVGVLAASLNLQDRAVLAGVNYPSTPSWDVCVGDVNNDGNEDFHVSLHMKNSGPLYQSNGDGTFARIATNISPRPTPGFAKNSYVDRHACAMADVDQNGLLDVYNAAGRWATNKLKDEGINNELWLQTAPGVYEDAATEAGVGEECSRGRFPVFADFNGDGWVDMFLGAQYERADSADVCNNLPDSPTNEQSKIFINRGLNSYGDWAGFSIASEYNVSQKNTGNRFAISWDENNDGRPDLLTQAFANNRPYFYRNNGTSFTEMSRAGTKRFPLMNGATTGDVNGDGYTDVVFADNNGFAWMRGTATGVSTSVNRIASLPSSQRAWGVAVGDINGDGVTDIYGLIRAATAGSANPDDIVYVGQAGGTFVAHAAPSAGGDANDVEAVFVNGRAQFVVLNGGNDEKAAPGPVQLISWVEN